MAENEKTREQLLRELEQLRQHTTALEASKTESERTAETALQGSQQRYRRLVESLPDIVYIFSDKRGALYWSSRVRAVLGLSPEELTEKPFIWHDSIHPDDLSRVDEAIEQCAKGMPFDLEYRIQDADGRWHWLHDRIIDTRRVGEETIIEGLAGDVTERKLAEEALREAHDELEQRVQRRTAALTNSNFALRKEIAEREKIEETLRDSEERFRQLAENIDDIFWLCSPDQNEILYISPAYERVWGRPCESLYQDPWSWLEAVVEEDRETVRSCVGMRLGQEPLLPNDMCYRIRSSDGTLRWILSRAFPILDEHGKICRVAGIAEDITEQKEAEQRLESEGQLLRKLLDLQERERRLVAHDIHDGFVQDVVSAKMVLEAGLHELETEKAPAADRFKPACSLLADAIAEGRRMIGELRPIVIDEEGVVAAMRHLIAKEYSDSSLQIDFSSSVRFDRLDAMLEGVVFRIAQEALTNVKRHGRCAMASVKLTQQDHQLVLEIRDDGVGFDPSRVPSERFGLRGIRERARLFGGQATIQSTPGKGTRIRVEMPLMARSAL